MSICSWNMWRKSKWFEKTSTSHHFSDLPMITNKPLHYICIYINFSTIRVYDKKNRYSALVWPGTRMNGKTRKGDVKKVHHILPHSEKSTREQKSTIPRYSIDDGWRSQRNSPTVSEGRGHNVQIWWVVLPLHSPRDKKILYGCSTTRQGIQQE